MNTTACFPSKPLEDLPPETLTNVLSYLKRKERFTASIVSHQFNDIIRHNIGFERIILNASEDCRVLKGSPLLKNTRIICYRRKGEILTYSDIEMACLAGVHTIYCSHFTTNANIRALVKTGTTIHKISLRNSGISDISLKALKSVHTINIDGCSNINEKGIKELSNVHKIIISKVCKGWLKHFCNTHSVSIRNNEIVDDEIRHLTNVKHLGLHRALRVSDSSLQQLVGLKKLILFDNGSITDSCLKHLTNLQHLKLAFCRNITGSCFKHLVNLKHLIIKNSTIKGENIRHLSTIDYLHIENYFSKTYEGLSYLPNLKHLTLGLCYITDAGMNQLVNLERLNILIGSKLTMGCLKHLTSLVYLNIHSQLSDKFNKKDVEDLGITFMTEDEHISEV
mmetsp:Transcript_14808/g.16444  ORF Transcript_14808/g.16444 Transcript_14808/m.16444 type:complete len:395 (+) Transcript_14808:144-1328(+)